MWWSLLLTAFAGTPDDAYAEALDAWAWGHWRHAYERATVAVEADPEDAAAQLLQGFALSRMGAWEEGVELVRPLVEDDEVGAHARFWVRRHDRRWTRNDWAIAAGVALRSDRGPFQVWHGGVALTVDVPLLEWSTVRVDVLSPIRHEDTLQLYGVQLAAVPLAHAYVGTWSFHAGGGPTVLLGEAGYWGGAFKGAFPGFRGSIGVDTRLSQRTALRLQTDYDVQFGARRFLPGSSHGLILRSAWVVFL